MEETDVLPPTVKNREQLFTELYKNTFPSVAKYVSRMGGSFEEAKDVFHDALVVYYEKSMSGQDLSVRQEKAYVLGTAKHLWTKRFQEKIRYTPLNSTDENDPLCAKEEVPSSEKLLRFLETAGQKCMELLRAFYYEKLPLEKAADRFGFSGVRSATAQKYKCLEKVRDTVKEKTLHYEDFLD